MLKEITTYDLAPGLGFSPATNSRGLSKCKMMKKSSFQCITKKAENMGRRRNNLFSSLRSRHAKTPGIIVPRLNWYFITLFLSGIEDTPNKEGFFLIISHSSDQKVLEISYANTSYNWRVECLLISLNIYESKPGVQDAINAAIYILTLKPEGRPDGVFCANEMSAVHCKTHFKKNDIKIPDEIAFAGFNYDAFIRMIGPKLRTTNFCGYEVGKVDVCCLINHFKGDFSIKTTSQIVLHPSLLVRGSSMWS